jgi:hypothetical protein
MRLSDGLDGAIPEVGFRVRPSDLKERRNDPRISKGADDIEHPHPHIGVWVVKFVDERRNSAKVFAVAERTAGPGANPGIAVAQSSNDEIDGSGIMYRNQRSTRWPTDPMARIVNSLQQSFVSRSVAQFSEAECGPVAYFIVGVRQSSD